ncbi:MAG: DUF1802 family protein [Oscillatoria sp. SIO1A7]|nr:DUF1802 family protein [Oscillatoria sp. SIO1A7]
MTNQSPIATTALCLPAPDIEALIQGRAIAALPRFFIHRERIFALYPGKASVNPVPAQSYYRPSFLAAAQTSAAPDSETVLIKAWARCEQCQIVSESESLETLSALTVWTAEGLEQIRQRQQMFLTYLRVYLLPEPTEISAHPQESEKNGKFISLPDRLTVTESLPVLSDRLFAQQRKRLFNRQPPPHPELEKLQGAIAPLVAASSDALQLDRDIRQFLGWSDLEPDLETNLETLAPADPDLAWIETIAETGNSSDGHGFEKLVRRSFIELGFSNSNRNPKASLDPEATGGAAGIDLYCEAPYPVVGECKASKQKKVPNSVTSQLIHLGVTQLGQTEFDRCIKLLVAAGQLTKEALKAAIENKMNAMRPETLQKLVELKAKYRGSIDLWELKKCLEAEPFGVVDDKISAYIDRVQQNIELRSLVIRLVKTYQENSGDKEVGVEAIYGSYNISPNRPQRLEKSDLHEILIELSSPLTGYLGRTKGSEWQGDRFYFLREIRV